MTTDAVLGPLYTSRTIELTPDDEGEVVATLVSRPAPEPTGRAVLYVHGYVDYFFQDHVAQFWVDDGYDFYALDLRKYGRSLLPHQTPNYCADLAEYDEELDEAVRIIRDEDHHTLVVMAHSMGGLVMSLWTNRRPVDTVDALVLNSPWLSPHNAPWVERNPGTQRAVEALGAIRRRFVLPMRISPHHGHSMHRDYRGEWEFDLTWKPHEGFPAHAGFGRALVRGHREVARGLDLRCPVLLACSTRSVRSTRWGDEIMRADALLNVKDMVTRGAHLGRHVTIVRIDGGVHDLALSAKAPREYYFAEVRRWCRAYVPNGNDQDS